MRRPCLVPALLVIIVAALPADALAQKFAPCWAKKRYDAAPLPAATAVALPAGHEFRKADVCVPVVVHATWKDRWFDIEHDFYDMTADEIYPGEFWYRADREEFVIVANGKAYRGRDVLRAFTAGGDACHSGENGKCTSWTSFGTDDVVMNAIMGSKTGAFLYE
jgi:hypothetical protein